MVKCTGRGLVVKRPGVLSKVQMLTLVLGVGIFSLLPILETSKTGPFGKGASENFSRLQTYPNLHRPLPVGPQLAHTRAWGREFVHVCSVKLPPERVPGDKFLSLPWKMWWKFRKVGILSPFSLGKYERKFATKNPPEFFTLGGGGKNAKFHHLNLLGAALRECLFWSVSRS